MGTTLGNAAITLGVQAPQSHWEMQPPHLRSSLPLGTTLGNSATTLGDPDTGMATRLGNNKIQTPQWGPHWEMQPSHWESRHLNHIGKFSYHIGRSRHRNGYHIEKFSPHTGRSRHHNGDHFGKFSHHIGRSRHHYKDHIGRSKHHYGDHTGKCSHHIGSPGTSITVGNAATTFEIQPPSGDYIGKFSHHIGRSRHRNGDQIGK